MPQKQITLKEAMKRVGELRDEMNQGMILFERLTEILGLIKDELSELEFDMKPVEEQKKIYDDEEKFKEQSDLKDRV